MNVSSVAPSAPVMMPDSSAPKSSNPNNGGDADPNAPPPMVLAPLPPGQGPRIDQIA
jgi:hypothetical protein